MTQRYRCSGCGNLTRFDVVTTRRTRAFHHYSVAGDLELEDETVLDERVEAVTCRWCGADDERIETIVLDDVQQGDLQRDDLQQGDLEQAGEAHP